VGEAYDAAAVDPTPVPDDTPRTVAERLALRLLVDTYAHHVDRADAEAVAGLFSAQGRLVAHFHYRRDGSPIVRTGRAEITAALVAGWAPYLATTHVVGGQVVDVHGDRAQGETVCLAHHVYERDGVRRLLVMAVRYADDYVCESGVWRFAERQLRLDWRHDHPLADGEGGREA